MMYTIKVLTDPGISWLQGRNGLFDIKAVLIEAWEHYNKKRGGFTVVSIDGISAKKGIVLNGGFQLSIEAMDELAAGWCKERNILVLDEDVGAAVDGLLDIARSGSFDPINVTALSSKLFAALTIGRDKTDDERRTS